MRHYVLECFRDESTGELGLGLLDKDYCGFLSPGEQDGTRIWYTHQGEEFRECFADEIEGAHIRHTGWYTDAEFADETARGIVVRLPHGRLLAGYYWSSNGARVYFPDIYTDAVDAAKAADELARIFGEHESEYQSRWRAADDLRHKIECGTRRLAELLELRHSKKFPQSRAEARDIISELRAHRRELETQYAEFAE